MSQCSDILVVLADGKPHSVAEIHNRAGFSRLNSRVAELRSRGYDIHHSLIGGTRQTERHIYRLISSPASGRDEVAAETATGSPVSPPPGEPAQQLDLFGLGHAA